MISDRVPELAPVDIANIIFHTADKKESDYIWGHGVINLERAMKYIDSMGYP